LEAHTNEGARFQATMFAKIFAEFVGAVEDFGALFRSELRDRGASRVAPFSRNCARTVLVLGSAKLLKRVHS
jgi:hypothetical protein